MRTIKFRGKSSLKGFHPWVYGFLFINDDEQTFIFSSVDDNAINQCPVYEETIGQLTGLTDKNGKEIYEGDIDNNGYVVKYCAELGLFTQFGYNALTKEYDRRMCYPLDRNIIIKGNIHDTPNLLNQ